MLKSFWMSVAGRESLIAANDIWGLLAVMCLTIYGAILLEKRFAWAARVSATTITLLAAMLLSNIGIVPNACPLFDDVVWDFLIPLAIPMLLLQCDLRRIRKETGPLLILFLIGAVGTVIGAFLAYGLLRGGQENAMAQAASMMTGSYIGGSMNLAAIASQINVDRDVMAAVIVADNVLMAAYFFVLIALSGSKFMRKQYAHPHIDAAAERKNRSVSGSDPVGSGMTMKDIAVNITFSACVVFLSNMIADVFASVPGDGLLVTIVTHLFGSRYIWITLLSVAAATFARDRVQKIRGSQEIGSYMIYLFFFAIGVPADISIVLTRSPLLLVLTGIMVLVNMLFCFIGAKLLRFSLEDAVIASNANIGGPTTSAGMAVSQGWNDLTGPAMLVGTLGYVIGNFAGMCVAIALGL